MVDLQSDSSNGSFSRFWCEKVFTPRLCGKPRDFCPLNMSYIHISELPMRWLRVPGDFPCSPYPPLTSYCNDSGSQIVSSCSEKGAYLWVIPVSGHPDEYIEQTRRIRDGYRPPNRYPSSLFNVLHQKLDFIVAPPSSRSSRHHAI